MKRKEIEKEVLSIIKTRHDKAISVADNNLTLALKNDEFKNLYVKYKDLIIQISKCEFLKQDTAELKKQMHNTYNLMQQELKKNGLSEQDLKPNYECKTCNDTGFNKDDKCNCFKNLVSQKLLDLSGRSLDSLPKFRDNNFEIFNDDNREEIKILYDKMQKYTDNLESTTKKIITFIGNTGVGKTHLVECMVRNAVENGYYTVYTTSFNLNNDFLKYHLSSLEVKSDVLNNYLFADLLVVDDLGTEPLLKNVTEEYLYMVISERLARKLNTIITTNLDLEQIRDVYGDRIFSRLSHQKDCILYKFKGNDLRLKK